MTTERPPRVAPHKRTLHEFIVNWQDWYWPAMLTATAYMLMDSHPFAEDWDFLAIPAWLVAVLGHAQHVLGCDRPSQPLEPVGRKP